MFMEHRWTGLGRGNANSRRKTPFCHFHHPKCHMSSLGFNPGLHDKRPTFLLQCTFLLII